MLIWFVFAVMTGAAVFVLLWPLGQRGSVSFADTADAASLYRSQLQEIERDLGRRLIAPAEAEAARDEAGRRLLRAADAEEAPPAETEPSLRRRRASSALTLSCVPLLALLVYGAQGSPDQPDMPLASRISGNPGEQDFAVALARIENHLAANPGDSRGWSILAPIYLRLGRYDEAARAFAAVNRLGQPSADVFAGEGEALALAAGGVVTVEARESFTQALKLDAAQPRARYYLAVARDQDGDRAGAVTALRALLADAPAGAEWAALVKTRLAEFEQQSSADAVRGLAPVERDAAIRGMVEGLSQRLEAQGGTVEEWLRLIRAQAVLGDTAAAKAAAGLARQRVASDPEAMRRIEALAAELGIEGAAP